jgi:thiol-disulfide isomerase/thioredoxin
MEATCCQEQSLFRMHAYSQQQQQQYYTPPTVTESNHNRRWRRFIQPQNHWSRHRSVSTAKFLVILLTTALLIYHRQLQQQQQFTTAFTTSSFYHTLFQPMRQPHGRFEWRSTTAGNAEMEYRQRSNPSSDSNNSNSSNNNGNKDETDFYVDSWKAVPGGFVPQFGNLIQKSNSPTQSTQERNAASHHSSQNQSSLNQSLSGSSGTSSTPSGTSSPMKKNTTPTTMRIRQLSNIKDYKHYVVDDVDPHQTTITVVRFYAPWCRACQAIQQRYYRLAQQYEQRRPLEESTAPPVHHSRSSPSTVVVRFMECPVTKDNAILHQGLGVPSLPYGHIYHSQVGLVEEMKLNKNVFTNFESILASYVNGYCTVIDDDIRDDKNDDDEAIPNNRSTPSTFG